MARPARRPGPPAYRHRARRRRRDNLVDCPLAERLAADGQGDPETVLLALHHVHLPKLAAAGLLSYDDTRSVGVYHGDALAEACLCAIADIEPGE